MGGLWIAADIETKPQRLKPIFIAFVSARLPFALAQGKKPWPDNSSDYVRSFAYAHPGAASGAPTTEKAKASEISNLRFEISEGSNNKCQCERQCQGKCRSLTPEGDAG
jgi:hypothetical protein